MNPVLIRDRLHKEIDRLPDEMVEQIADFTLFIMGRRNVAPMYEDWGQKEWQNFALEQFFREDDEVEYTLKDAKEVYRP